METDRAEGRRVFLEAIAPLTQAERRGYLSGLCRAAELCEDLGSKGRGAYTCVGEIRALADKVAKGEA